MKPWLIASVLACLLAPPLAALAASVSDDLGDAQGVQQSVYTAPAQSTRSADAVAIPTTGAINLKWQGYFDALKDARSPQEAQQIEATIARMLARTGSSTVDLLLDRARALTRAGKLDAARALLDQSVALEPSAAEAWRRRAEVAAMQHDYMLAIDDLHYAISIEPAHFLALRSLGKLYADGQDKAAAIAAYRAALALNPWLNDVAVDLARLEATVSN